MYHPAHDEPKKLKQALEAAHHDALMSLHESVGLLKSSVNEALVFIEAGNMLQAAASLTALYYDCDDVQKRIMNAANKG